MARERLRRSLPFAAVDQPSEWEGEHSMIQDLSRERELSSNSLLLSILSAASKLDRVAMGMLRDALVVVLFWIGGLKFVNYEADSIVPLVANSPVMSFLYHHPSEYKTHMNKEGELNPQH